MRLPFDRDGMGAINYRFALSNPTLVSALSQKIVFQRQLPDLGVHRLDVHRGLGGAALCKNIGGSCAELPFPIGYLIGMYFKLLRQFGQRLVSLGIITVEWLTDLFSQTAHHFARMLGLPLMASVG